MITFLRLYVIIPILLTIFVHIINRKLVIGGRGIVRGTSLYVPYGIMALVSCPILKNEQKTQSEEEKQQFDRKRRMWFLTDSIVTFIVYGLTLASIIVLWENTNELRIHLNTCTFEAVKSNVPMICGSLSAIGLIHCLMCLFYIRS